jgi:uncharacterized protein YbaP (TraB family)
VIRFLFALAGALALASCGGEPARDWPEPSPALWEVSGSNGEGGWLFGTIHALPDGAEWRTPAFEQAFAQANLLMVEIGNLGDAEDATKAFETYATGPAQPPLSMRVSAEDRPALAALLERAHMEERDFWNVETWAAAMMLADAARDAEAENGVDRQLLSAGKTADALESYAQQFDRFDSLSQADQRELLASTARDAQRDDADARIEAWLTGDLAAIEQQMTEGFLSRPALRKALLTDRNELFASRIALRLEEGAKPFVAVGTAHLLGPDGLPALLSSRGYTVTRVQ